MPKTKCAAHLFFVLYLQYYFTEKTKQLVMEVLLELATKTVTLSRNEYLKWEDSIDTNLYFVERGSLRIFIMDNEEEKTIRFGYQGNMITALDSFLTGQASKLQIQALKKTIVKVIPKLIIEEYINKAEHQIFWIKILESLIQQQLEREIDLLTASPKERYDRVLKRSPEVFQQIPNRYIANYLRMSPETLSRLKKS